MNIAYFLLPKNTVAYLYDDYTFRQGLEKMRYHGYTAIPVITREASTPARQRGRFPLAAAVPGGHPPPSFHEGAGGSANPGYFKP